jgi:hypothetical protein
MRILGSWVLRRPVLDGLQGRALGLRFSVQAGMIVTKAPPFPKPSTWHPENPSQKLGRMRRIIWCSPRPDAGAPWDS